MPIEDDVGAPEETAEKHDNVDRQNLGLRNDPIIAHRTHLSIPQACGSKLEMGRRAALPSSEPRGPKVNP